MSNILRNWKSSASGIVGLLVILASIWAPPEIAAKVAATGSAIAASGLLWTKDHDKTGVK